MATDDNTENSTRNRTEYSMLCYPAIKATSAGVWIGDNPLEFSFPLLIYQIIIIFIFSRITHFFLRRLSQPVAISQIIAGVILGPSVLGRYGKFEDILFSPRSWQQLNTVALLFFMLFLFMIGVKTDLTMIPKAGKKAVAIAILSSVLPAGIIMLVAHLQGPDLPLSFREGRIPIKLASKWSRTSYTVLSCALAELELLTSKLGRLAMSASLIIDVASLFVTSGLGGYRLSSRLDMPGKAAISIACFFGFLFFVVFLARPFIVWLIRRRTPEGALLDEACFMTVIFLALGCGLISEVIGYHATMGPFILGLALPGGAPLGVTVVEKMDRLVTGVFLPVFLATAGLHMDLPKLTLSGFNQWGLLEAYILILTLAKFIGVMLPCLYCKMPLRDALSVGLMMNARGIFEVDTALQWRDSKSVDDQLYAVLILSIIIIGGGTAPLLKYLYHPEDRFVAYKRRTVQHSKSGDELRVLVCIHNQDNVAPIITLLETSHPIVDSPICVYLLHLVQLVGRADAILVPHKRHRSSHITDSDRIINAFRFFEQQHPSSVSLIPYVCISPYATMHDDICSLALDKKVTLVILPFHRNATFDGTLAAANPALQAINCNAVRYAPCSVAILVDHGLTAAGTTTHALAGGARPLQRIAVYFLGGADDREALAYAARMAEDPAVGLTVVRIRPPMEWRCDGGKDELLDDEMVDEFRRERLDGERVQYREEVSRDGEDTVRVIQETSDGFSLLLVGRREGMESPLTDGMSMWSEYPELGVIGDLLASTDFGGRVSTLVVQQQTRVRSTQAESPMVARAPGSQVAQLNQD
ncbi:cation/H(+) antiporter 15-like [Phoenix dactylifera]|uniref:Cation/H(+) antiporter 15-like n=1 Tax=Phoenix dactylifera TaxID=42345 RepID=A0A8B8ZAT7_PHODC|nr:cation/H(+) antiporter 15-like [Phoenix dactylifera]